MTGIKPPTGKTGKTSGCEESEESEESAPPKARVLSPEEFADPKASYSESSRRCDCWRLTRPLRNGEVLPDHVCPHTAQETCRAWARDNLRFSGDAPSWVPLPDGRFMYAEPNCVKTGILRVADPSLPGASAPRMRGHVVLILRQWVEVNIEAGNGRFGDGLIQKLPGLLQIDRAYAGEGRSAGNRCSPDQIERFRRRLVSIGFPATPGNSRCLDWRIYGICDLEPGIEPTPTRGALVTSLGVMQGNTWPRSVGEGDTFDTLLTSPVFFNGGRDGRELLDRCHDVMQSHTRLWESHPVHSAAPRLLKIGTQGKYHLPDEIDAAVQRLMELGLLDSHDARRAEREQLVEAMYFRQQEDAKRQLLDPSEYTDPAPSRKEIAKQVSTRMSRAIRRLRDEKP